MSGKKLSEIVDKSELRSVRPVDLGGLALVPKAGVGKPPRVEFVDPRDLYVESAYQRDVVERGKPDLDAPAM